MPESNFFEDVFPRPFSPTEKRLLMRLRKEAATTADIAAHIGRHASLAHARVVMHKIRRKLEGTGWKIETEEGGWHKVGTYRLEREG